MKPDSRWATVIFSSMYSVDWGSSFSLVIFLNSEHKTRKVVTTVIYHMDQVREKTDMGMKNKVNLHRKAEMISWGYYSGLITKPTPILTSPSCTPLPSQLWLYSSSHQKAEPIISSLESGLALWLGESNRVLVSSLDYKKPFIFTLFLFDPSTPWERAWLACWKDKEPSHGIPSKVILRSQSLWDAQTDQTDMKKPSGECASPA